MLTERCELRPADSNDLSLFHAINTNSFVLKFLWDDKIISERTTKDILKKNVESFNNSNYGLWLIFLKSLDKPVGYAGLWHFFDEEQPQLLYTLLEKYTGRGLAKEFSNAIIQYAFNSLNFEYLIASTDTGNLSSQVLAVRLGMNHFKTKILKEKETLFFRIFK